MRIIRARDYDDMSRKAAAVISSQVTLKPESVLGLATGSTVKEIYGVLGKWNSRGTLDFSRTRTVNLDEYVGLPPDHPQSYHYYMKTNFFDKINIDVNNTHIQNGVACELDEECRRYDGIIDGFGRLDLQLLGLGYNGHIGFNEPSDKFHTPTHCVELMEETISSNARFFADESQVPRQALTMGIKSISQSRIVLLCVSGSQKAEVLKRVLAGPVVAQVPGSILQLHPNLIIVADEDALALI